MNSSNHPLPSTDIRHDVKHQWYRTGKSTMSTARIFSQMKTFISRDLVRTRFIGWFFRTNQKMTGIRLSSTYETLPGLSSHLHIFLYAKYCLCACRTNAVWKYLNFWEGKLISDNVSLAYGMILKCRFDAECGSPDGSNSLCFQSEESRITIS